MIDGANYESYRTDPRLSFHLKVDPIPASKQGISNSMKDRLRREASAGLDSNSKQTNVILYISAAIVILVLLGGQGIFF
jgi:hypothetical protein